MGDPEGWPQPSGLLPGALFSNLDDERWALAENRTVELINRIKPNPSSEVRRRAVADHVEALIRKCFDCQVFTFGSVPLKTYLPDGDIDLTTFSWDQHLQEAQANEVRAVLEAEERSKDAQFRVKEVQYIQAEVKIIKCLVENIVVDISFNQLGGLCTLCFLEEVDRLIGRNHLFKRSIILVKAWCYYESRILGAHHGLISTYALETLVLYIFHLFHESLHGPLAVLFRFLEFFSSFDWEKYCISLWGPIPLSALPDMLAEPPRKDGGRLLLSRAFLEGCSRAYAVLPNGHGPGNRAFGPKFLNVVDPLKTANNLGRSVNKGNFYRIRSAFNMGAKTLMRILECPVDNVVDELDKFFLNTWDRHGNGKRPDAPEHIERLLSFDGKDENTRVASSADLLQEMVAHSPSAAPAAPAPAAPAASAAAAAAAVPSIANDTIHRFGALSIRDQAAEVGGPSNHVTSAEENRRNKPDEADRRSHKQREKGIVPDDRMLNGDRDWTDRPLATTPDGLPKGIVWGNADVPPFYPRSAEEDEGQAVNWDVSNRGYGLNNMAPHHLPVPGPPPPPINIHPPSPVTEGPRLPSFGSHPPGFLPMRRGPVPPPFPQYNRPGVPPQRMQDGENHHPDESRQEKENEMEDPLEHGRGKLQAPAGMHGQPPSTRKGSRELSPDAANFYEQNGTLHGDVDGWHRSERKSRAAEEVPGEGKTVDELLESRRPPDGHIPPPGEPWPVLDPALLQYSQMLPQGHLPVVYTGLSPPLPDSALLAGHSDASSPVSSSFSPKRGSSAPQSSSVGILQPSNSDTAAARKQRPVPVDTQAAPSFYYSPFPFMVPYSPMPFYVIPQESGGEGTSSNETTTPDGQPQSIFGDSERHTATASANDRHSSDRSLDGDESEPDLLTSDFAKHLRNLDYGRACQSPGPMFPHPGFLPFGKELQGHYTWEGPGRPVQANMKHGSRFPRNYQRNFPGPPGFSGEEAPKARSGTGTYLPGTRPYRERHIKGQHDGFQEREFAERDGPPRYQRNMGRGQNNRLGQGGVKPGDKGWHDGFGRIHAVPVTLTSGSQTGAVLTPSQLEAYTYMNANGSTPAGPLILMYPSNEVAGLEFGSMGQMPSPDHGAGRGMSRAHTTPASTAGHDRQPPSPMSEQRPAQRTYQMKEEDFPPLSFKARGASSSTSGSGTSKYQTYVASQS